MMALPALPHQDVRPHSDVLCAGCWPLAKALNEKQRRKHKRQNPDWPHPYRGRRVSIRRWPKHPDGWQPSRLLLDQSRPPNRPCTVCGASRTNVVHLL